MSEKKGIHWLVWVGGGCALVAILGVVAVLGLGIFAVNKATDLVEEVTENPITMMARAYDLANPEVEFVEADEEGRTVVFRNTETGETATFDFSDLESGRIRFEDSSGDEVNVDASDGGLRIESNDGTIGVGASAGDVPDWVPVLPNGETNATYTSNVGEQVGGQLQIVTDASLDDAAAEYKALLEAAGYSIETELSQGDEMRMLMGKQGQRQVSAAFSPYEGRTQAAITYAERP